MGTSGGGGATARRLEVDGIVATAERLSVRVEDRFADRGICILSSDLVNLSRETAAGWRASVSLTGWFEHAPPSSWDLDLVGLLVDVDTLHLDRGYDYPVVRARLTGRGLEGLNIQRRRQRGAPPRKEPMRLGLRWVVEGTNSWLSNYGQLRRNTDRRTHHRHAQLCLVTAVLITAKLIDHRDRWSPS